MSVLIKGMKMPKEKPLRIVLNPNGQLFVDHGSRFTEYETVEVPTPHGRLIDADELEADTEWSERHDDYAAFSRAQINSAPTIIEAEEAT